VEINGNTLSDQEGSITAALREILRAETEAFNGKGKLRMV
jgi:hypothetical protein